MDRRTGQSGSCQKLTGGESTPWVRLSPNPMNVVLVSFGAAAMATEKLQEADCAAVSEARHVTVAFPTANELPDSGVQVVVTGA